MWAGEAPSCSIRPFSQKTHKLSLVKKLALGAVARVEFSTVRLNSPGTYGTCAASLAILAFDRRYFIVAQSVVAALCTFLTDRSATCATQ